MAIDIHQQSAIATTPFGDQDAGRENRGRMELHGFHVAERRHAGLERERGADAFADDGIGRHPIQTSGAAGGDGRGLGHVGAQLAGDEVARHRAVTPSAVMNQRERLDALVHGNLLRNRAVAHGEQHRMAGAVRDVTGAPFARAAEVALRHEAMRFVSLGDRHLLAIDDDVAVAALDAAPGHAPRGKFAHGLGSGVDEHAHHSLIGAPVAAANGVLEVHVLVVTLALDDISEARLHAALRGRGVRALRRYQREHQRIVTASLRGDGEAEPRKAAADDQAVGVNDLHGVSGAAIDAGT